MTAVYLEKLRKVTAWWLLNQALMVMTTASKSEKVSDDINAAHSYGRNALSETILFCLMTYGYRKMKFYSELQNHLSFIKWLKWLSFLTPTHGDLCHSISAWFTVCLFHRTIPNPVFHERIQTFKQEWLGSIWEPFGVQAVLNEDIFLGGNCHLCNIKVCVRGWNYILGIHFHDYFNVVILIV